MELTPKQSSNLAEDVYDLAKLPNLEKAVEMLNLLYKGSINFREEDAIKGVTGGSGLIKVRTAFGFLLVGKGAYKGHAFLLFRGSKYIADHLTNANFTISRTHSGQQVHDGFKMAFQSTLSQIQPFVSNLSGEIKIHCIGHSLGGALATLAAD